jgi:hypothetical protein
MTMLAPARFRRQQNEIAFVLHDGLFRRGRASLIAGFTTVGGKVATAPTRKGAFA